MGASRVRYDDWSHWRVELARSCSARLGAMSLGLALLSAIWLAAPPLSTLGGLVAGAALLALARTGATWLGMSLPPLLVLGGAVTLGAIHWGWAPVIVLSSGALVVLVGLLAGRAAVLAAIGLQAVGLAWGGTWIAPRLDPTHLALLDPSAFMHWARVGTAFLLVGATLASILVTCSDWVSGAFRHAQEAKSRAEQLLEWTQRSRDTRLKAQKELAEQQKLQAITRLSAGLSRLVQESLTVTSDALRVLEQPKWRSASWRQACQAIASSAARIGTATRGLMVFSRRSNAVPERWDLLGEATLLVEDLRTTHPPQVELVVQGAPQQFARMARDQLRQLAVNLVLNAIEALPRGGRVLVSVLPPAQGSSQGQLLVEDDGTGMAPEVLERCTDPFFTTKPTTVHPGLGLTVCAGIAARAGGALELESALGRGTRVRCRLPVESSPSSTEQVQTMHGELLSAERSDADAPALEEQLPEPSAVRWKGEMSQRLGRIMVFVGSLAIAHSWWRGSAFPPSPAATLALVAVAAAGWWPRLSPTARAGLLTVGTALGTVGSLASISYLSPALASSMLLVVAWASLLGSRRTAALALGAIFASLLLLGWLYERGDLSFDASVIAMTDPANWRKVAFSLSLLQWALAASVLAIIEHGRRGIQAARTAEAEMSRARELEERETANREALERNRARSERLAQAGRALGGVAHDLNNALQGLVGPAQELLEEELSSEEADQCVTDLRRAYELSLALGLQFVGSESPERITRDATDLSRMLERDRRLLESTLHDGIQLTANVEAGLVLPLNETDVQRLLHNLLANARDAIEGTGSVRIEAHRSGDCVELIVSDTGTGMEEGTKRRLFEPFFTTKPEGHGTGLGLYSVRSIVERSEGDLSFDSHRGGGSQFRIRWPLRVPIVEASPSPAPPQVS